MIALSRSAVGSREAEAVRRVLLEDGYLGMGQEVRAFEHELAHFLGVEDREVACVSSGTAALQLAVEAVVQPGDEVLVQSLTFVASFQAIAAAGAVPVACDVRRESIAIDLEDARRRVTPRTRAIMPVHYASYVAAPAAIRSFAAEYGLRVIEDAAHAFGGNVSGRPIGHTGDVVCFSFDGIKNITSAEGGAVVTRDQTVIGRVRDARLLGVERDTEQRYGGGRSWDFDVTRRGYRYHMSNVCAAIGRVQLERFTGELAPVRRMLAARYRSRLEGRPGLVLLDSDAGAVPHIFPLRITSCSRDNVREQLKSQGVETGIHYKPNHLLTLFHRAALPLPVTEEVYPELLSLPLHPGLSVESVDYVCDRLLECCAGSAVA